MAMGRPREFDVDKALDLALQVFWSKGYEGASMADLTETMGITKPSLYAAFGNKEELFRKTLDRYVDGPGGYVQVALAKPTIRAVVEHLLYGAADAVSDPDHPPGCLAVQGALSCGDAAESIKQELMARRATGEEDLRKRFERAIAEHDLPAGSDAADLARYISAILQGMAVQAAGGTTREQLRKIAEMTLRTWPPPASATTFAPAG
jgi:AcrR family transcriptional regulator